MHSTTVAYIVPGLDVMVTVRYILNQLETWTQSRGCVGSTWISYS